MGADRPTGSADRRLEALLRFGRLADVGRERLDELAALAALACETPIAFIAFLDEYRLWFKGTHGWRRDWLPREITFCQHAIAPAMMLSVPDALEDARFSDNPLVTGDPHIRSYASAPLVTVTGECLGTLCVIDREPRQLNARQMEILQLLAQQVMVTLELLRQKDESATTEKRVQRINRVYALLSGVRQSILRERGVDAILRAACQIAVDRAGMAMAWIGMAERPGDAMRVAAHAGATPETLELVASLLGKNPSLNCSFTMRALGSGEIGVCNDIAVDDAAASWRDEALARGYRSMASLPIKVSDVVRGTLNLYSREPGFFDSMELSLLGELARDIGLALDLVEREKERAQAEAALRRAEQRFREFADNVEQVFWIREADTPRILYASPAYEKIWGRERSALYESPTGWRSSIVEQDLPHAEAASRARETGAEATATYRITRPDGEIRWIHERAFGSRNESGSVIHIVGTAEDITESRNLEEHLRQAQKLEAIGQLAGGVAHDFNNILTIIEGFASLLSMEAGLSQDGREAVHEIVSASARATRLTRQLLAFGRRQVVQPEAIDLNETIRALSSLLQRVIGEHVQLVLDLETAPCTARVDASMLDQIIMNLVINARDAMPEGGELRIATFAAVIERGGREKGGLEPGAYVGFSVSDTGLGIAPEHLSRIFEPFFTTKGPGKGTGLGLSTVYGIVSQHRGGVFVESVPEAGSRFEVWLPATAAQARQPAPVVRGAPPSLKRPQDAVILLVEDDPHVRALTRTVLEREGYQVCEATHGPEALRVWAARGGQVDLLLTDMVMPGGMNGTALASELRKQRPNLPVLFMSGYSPDVAGRELAGPERGPLIQKPASPRAILEAVQGALVNRADRTAPPELQSTGAPQLRK